MKLFNFNPYQLTISEFILILLFILGVLAYYYFVNLWHEFEGVSK